MEPRLSLTQTEVQYRYSCYQFRYTYIA